MNIDAFSSDYINISEFLLRTFSKRDVKITVYVHYIQIHLVMITVPISDQPWGLTLL